MDVTADIDLRIVASVIESSGDVIALVNADYQFIIFNSAFRDEFKKIFGRDLKPGDSINLFEN